MTEMGRGDGRGHVWIISLLVFCLFECSVALLSYTVSEEADKGTAVGNLAKDLGLIVRELESRALQIASGHSKKYFDANLKTGALLVNERIDREELCPHLAKCIIKIQAILSNPMNIYRIEVHVLDINDNGPVFLEQNHAFNISESSSTGERYPLPAAIDPDAGSNSVHDYKLNQNEYFSLDVQGSGEDTVSAELVLKKALDR